MPTSWGGTGCCAVEFRLAAIGKCTFMWPRNLILTVQESQSQEAGGTAVLYAPMKQQELKGWATKLAITVITASIGKES